MQKFKFEKGLFLVFTLLLTVLVTSACLLMVQTATMHRRGSNAASFRTNLKNIATQIGHGLEKTLTPTTAGGLMSTLESRKANIFLADTSTGSPVVVCNVTSNALPFACNPTSTANPNSISSLSDQFIISRSPDREQATLSLSPAGTPLSQLSGINVDPNLTPEITFTQKSYSSNATTATYNLDIKVKVSGRLDGNLLDESNTEQQNFTFTRSCPNSNKSLDSPGKTMRPLTDAEIKQLSGGQYTTRNTYPNLYCTCSQPGFTKTNPDGTCVASCNASCATCSGPGANQCTSCAGNKGLSSGTCSTCTGNTYFVNNTSPCGNCHPSCATCSGPGANQCTSCNGSMGLSSGTCSSCTGRTYFVNNTSPCGTCNASCTTCSGPGANQCTSCSGSMGLNSGTCSSCTGRTYFVNNTSPCGNCYSSCATCSGGAANQCTSCIGSMGLNSGTCSACTGNTYFVNNTSPCGTCYSSCATCSGGASNQCLTCAASYTPSGTTPSGTSSCVAACTGGSVVGGSGQSTGVSNCACPNNTYYWNGSNCVLCPNGSKYGYGYGPMTPIGSCRCVDNTAIWSGKFQMCVFPCRSYDTGSYLCNEQSGSPTYGFFCAYCSGSNCTGHSWGTTQSINISKCAYCTPTSSCDSIPNCTGGTVIGGTGDPSGVADCACPDYNSNWYNGSCHFCPSGVTYQRRCTHTRPEGVLDLNATCDMFRFFPCKEDGICGGGAQGYYRQIGGCPY